MRDLRLSVLQDGYQFSTGNLVECWEGIQQSKGCMLVDIWLRGERKNKWELIDPGKGGTGLESLVAQCLHWEKFFLSASPTVSAIFKDIKQSDKATFFILGKKIKIWRNGNGVRVFLCPSVTLCAAGMKTVSTKSKEHWEQGEQGEMLGLSSVSRMWWLMGGKGGSVDTGGSDSAAHRRLVWVDAGRG